MDNIEEKNILQIIAAVIAESLRSKNKFPTGETLRKEVNAYAEDHNHKKTRYSASEISKLKDIVLVEKQLIDFSGIHVKGGLDQSIGDELVSTFELEQAIVVDNNDIVASGRNINEYLGMKAAEYLQQDFYGKTVSRIPVTLNEKARGFFEGQLAEELKSLTKVKQKRRKILTFSCGSSVGAAIDSLNGDFSNTTIYSSIILFTDAFEGLSPSQLVHNFSNKFKGSIGVASQIPFRVLGLLEVSNQNEFYKRRSIYRNIVDPSLDKALDSDYLMLGVGGIPRDKKFGGVSFHVEQEQHAEQKQKLWTALSKKCCGEISHWPILNKPVSADEDDLTNQSIWLWDYLWKKQMKFENERDLRDECIYDQEGGLFIDYFIKTYTINFNKLMSLKSLHREIIGRINRLADEYKEMELHDELHKLLYEDKYRRILGLDSSTTEMSPILGIIDKLDRRKVITPAGGVGKAEPLYQCLNTKRMIDVLVTDSNTAKEIMSLRKNATLRK